MGGNLSVFFYISNYVFINVFNIVILFDVKSLHEMLLVHLRKRNGEFHMNPFSHSGHCIGQQSKISILF